MVGHGYSEVSQITPEIYVGPQVYRVGKHRLEMLGIRHSINMQAEFDGTPHGFAFENHLYLPTIDDEAPTLDQLRQGVDFIQRAVDEGGRVYIHCAGGIGRSPTMAVPYFISQGLTLHQAIDLIKKKRPVIHLAREQIEQLKIFETMRKNLRQ